ncbi:MAG: tetratricopeptide repeat protein [Candidatus Schekmanbacteria bacterium]|nr:tetratricopeptide repeat protein [Candidatus Schekmanbacteria bacterium]
MTRIGELHIAPFRVLDVSAAGAMGVVYRAVDERTGELVAIKTVKTPRRSSVAGLRREIEGLRRLNHPGVVRIVASGDQDVVPWYAMTWVEGTPLLAYSTQRQGTAVERMGVVLTVVREICAVLAYIHGEGVVHRDLKPANIIVAAAGYPVLVDFGLAAVYGAEGSREALDTGPRARGTLTYLSPEQLRGQPTDARADLYALGCILYELVCGRPPFGGSAAEVIRGHLHEEPPALRLLAPDAPPRLAGLLARLLAKEPRARLGYADHVAACLGELGALAPSFGEHAVPPTRAYLYRPALHGRAAELAELTHNMRESRAPGAHGRLVLIAGEAGVGKTKLASELATLAAGMDYQVLAGSSGERETTALAALQAPALAISDRCRELGSGEQHRVFGERIRVLAEYFAPLRGLPAYEEYPDPGILPYEAARQRLFGYLAETLEALADSGPVLLLLDDLQWADELSHLFLRSESFGAVLSRAPVLVFGFFRGEPSGGPARQVAAECGAQYLELRRLSQADTEVLVGDMLAMPSLPRQFAAHLYRHGEGNPFFVAEYLCLAVAEGLLWRDATGAWQIGAPADTDASAGDYEALPIPQSLRDLSTRRLAGLSADAMRVCRCAAVLGAPASEALLARVAELDADRFTAGMLELLRRDVLSVTPEQRLQLANDTLCRIAYASLDAAERVAAHRGAAAAIAAVGEEEATSHAANLGGHWEQAGELERAMACYLGAARKSRDQYAHAAAERQYRAYLRLAPAATQDRVEARNELAVAVLYLTGRTDESLRQLALSLEDAAAARLEAVYAETLRLRATVERGMGRLDEALASAGAALAILQRLGQRRGAGKVLADMAVTEHDRGRLQEARAMYQEALDAARATGDRAGEGSCLGNLGVMCLDLQDRDGAEVFFAAALPIFRELGDRRFASILLGNLATMRKEQGRMEEALELYTQACDVARELGDRRSEGLWLTNLAWWYREARGDYRRGEELLARAMRLFQESRAPYYIAIATIEAGRNALCRLAPAAAHLERADALAARLAIAPDGEIALLIGKLRRAEAARAAGDTDELFRGQLLRDYLPAELAWLERSGQLPAGSAAAAP